MWEKRRTLLMKDYSATLINNLWGLHHHAHLPHHFTWGFEAVAPQSCPYFFYFLCNFWYLIQPIDLAALNPRSCFSTCSYLTLPLGHEYPQWRSGFECSHMHLKLARMDKSWKDGDYLSAQGSQTNSTMGWWVCVYLGGGLFCVQITEQAYIICSAQRIDKISAWLLPLSHSWSTVCTVQTDMS